jgi:uroporphyrinogen-III decarboxylase
MELDMTDNQLLYEERKRRFYDTIELRKTDRVPIVPFADIFPMRLYGVTLRDALYDHARLEECYLRYHEEFQPDVGDNPYGLFGQFKILDKIGYSGMRWAGHGLPDDSPYQYHDKELMSADLYDWWIRDPTDFMLRHLIPKLYDPLAPLAKLASIRTNYFYNSAFEWARFADPDLVAAAKAIAAGAEEAIRTLGEIGTFSQKLAAAGWPEVIGGCVHAPMDVIADFFRGIRGLLGDLKRRPDKVLAAADKLIPSLIELGLGSCAATGVPVCFFPLHMLVDSFISQEQFERFYWPQLLEIIRAVIAKGVYPHVLVEGVCDKRLPIMIRDVPPGTCVFHLENSDIFAAKKLARDKVCLRGNVPVTLLMTGTPDEVRAYCKRLIDEVGAGGGFMMDCGVNIGDAKPENVRAMFEFTRQYGVY